MIHPVHIVNFDPSGVVEFRLGGRVYRAEHAIGAQEADGVVVNGGECPLQLSVYMSAPVEYLAAPAETLDIVGRGPRGDRVCARGRIMDYFAHDVIRLDGALAVGVKLVEPQQATDYRRGSWLEATGILHADLPPPDHDEKGLIGSIVE